MPFLLPPPDFTSLELNQKRITGTMEAQICRSASPWSIGTPKRIEHSIQNAYIKAIQLSDHFVYIEVCPFPLVKISTQEFSIRTNFSSPAVSKLLPVYSSYAYSL